MAPPAASRLLTPSTMLRHGNSLPALRHSATEEGILLLFDATNSSPCPPSDRRRLLLRRKQPSPPFRLVARPGPGAFSNYSPGIDHLVPNLRLTSINPISTHTDSSTITATSRRSQLLAQEEEVYPDLLNIRQSSAAEPRGTTPPRRRPHLRCIAVHHRRMARIRPPWVSTNTRSHIRHVSRMIPPLH